VHVPTEPILQCNTCDLLLKHRAISMSTVLPPGELAWLNCIGHLFPWYLWALSRTFIAPNQYAWNCARHRRTTAENTPDARKQRHRGRAPCRKEQSPRSTAHAQSPVAYNRCQTDNQSPSEVATCKQIGRYGNGCSAVTWRHNYPTVSGSNWPIDWPSVGTMMTVYTLGGTAVWQ